MVFLKLHLIACNESCRIVRSREANYCSVAAPTVPLAGGFRETDVYGGEILSELFVHGREGLRAAAVAEWLPLTVLKYEFLT